MTKKWIKYYLFIGTFIMLILVLTGSFLFVKDNISQAEQKRTFESIYVDTTIDFIVPSPSIQQANELENDENTGIEAFTPYYETSSGVSINESVTNKGAILLFPDAEKLQYTPYTSKRVLQGSDSYSSGDAIVDSKYMQLNNCKLGDKVSFSIANKTYDFTIKSISEENTFYKDGTIVLILSSEQNAQLNDNGISYSSAYVKASDYSKCKNYLNNEYKPMGRIKDPSSFKDEATYSQHLDNFNNADWSQEITNLTDNYNTLKIKYDNVDSGIRQNNIINAVIVAVVIFIMNIIFVSNKSIKQFMRNSLVKKNVTKAKISSFYTKGILFNFIVYACCSVALFFYTMNTSFLSTKSTMMNCVYPVASALAMSIIMIIVTSAVVSASYTIKKQNTTDNNADDNEVES